MKSRTAGDRGTALRYFRSRVFKRLFFTYALIITLIFALVTAWYVTEYRRETQTLTERDWSQRAVTWGNWMDRQLLQAQSLCAAVNNSDSCRDVLQTAYVEKKTIDSLQLYNMLGELNRIKGSARSIGIYSLMLVFQGDSRVYLPGSVVSVQGGAKGLQAAPYLGVTTAAKLLDVQGSQIVLNKEYLIYADTYTGFGSQASQKGLVAVLIEKDALNSGIKNHLGTEAGILIRRSGQRVCAIGAETGRAFPAASLADGAVEYTVFAPESDFAFRFPVSMLAPILMFALIGLLFILATYFTARRFYRPIDHIRQMMDGPAYGKSNEFDGIISGISDLIGERNGYREKMVTITPYARHGMLQAVLHGSQHPEPMVEEQFTELKHAWFMVGALDIAITGEGNASARQYQDRQELILSACQGLSGEEIQVVATPENLQHLFVIAASDEKEVFDDFFYRLYAGVTEAVGDENTAITIGVGRRESDLDRLPAACREALASLDQMLTGGRGAVYFPEEKDKTDAGYFFPKDAVKQMVRFLKEKDLDGLYALLDEIYAKNLVEADLPADEIRQLADELYWTIRKALRNAYDMSTVHVRMEPIREAVTIDEIFAYYRQVFRTVLEETPVPESEESQTNLEDGFCAWLEEHLYDPDLSLNKAADEFGVSTKMVGLICRKKYGQTFLTYVRDRQIRRAAELLKETDCSLEEISSRCGFTSVLTFRRNFKAVMGVNPSEYRA